MSEQHSLHGQRLGHYLVGDVIGLGSFSTVYRAQDERLDSTVVVKVLAENHSLNPEVRERFIAEGRSLRRIGSAHAIAVHDIGESDRQQPYLVLEYADRGTLRQRVEDLWQQGWRARPEDILEFAAALAAAVDVVHRARLVHRDLSPGNLLLATAPTQLGRARTQPLTGSVVRADERLLIADLGMCKDLALNSGLTVATGTSGFRPPEQHGPGVVDTRADIWAMSALLNWLAQGADLPRAFGRLLRRGMSDKPQRRPPDVEAWLGEVREALAPEPEPEQDVSAREHSTTTPATSTSGLPSWAIPVLGAVALCAVLLGLVGGYLLTDPQDPPSSAGDSFVAIQGPEDLTVGESVTFTANVSGVDSWSWLLPTGRYVANEEQVSLTPTVPGRAQILLRAKAPDGTELETRRTVRVGE